MLHVDAVAIQSSRQKRQAPQILPLADRLKQLVKGTKTRG
jgi:hypothetical protein